MNSRNTLERPQLNKQLDAKIFLSFYYLKNELVDFCKLIGLPTTGGKVEITDRIAHYLNTGEILISKQVIKRKTYIDNITEDTLIEHNFVCSEKHRAFFKDKIGEKFSFNVTFQKWIKSNSENQKTYKDAINAYYKIIDNKRTNTTVIGKQFEYNSYIRDFFADNHDKQLNQAILCWKYKKSLQGDNNYEKSDLKALDCNL